MNVKSIERKGNEATVVVEIDKELMESGVNKAYMKARKSIQLPGFRKGKAPRKMIEAMYGAHVFYEDGLEEIFPEIYDFAIAKQDFKAIGRPNLTDMQIGDDNIVTLTLTTEVYPEVTLGQYKGLEVEKEEVNVTDEQVQAELDRMAQNVASTETVERPAKMGDTANIDFEGFDNGVPFEGGKGDTLKELSDAVNAAQLHVSHAVCLAGGYLTVNAVGGFVGEGGIEKSCHICTTFPYNNYKLILYIICAYFKSEEVGFTKYFRLVKEKPADSETYGRRLLQFSLMSVCAASKQLPRAGQTGAG